MQSLFEMANGRNSVDFFLGGAGSILTTRYMLKLVVALARHERIVIVATNSLSCMLYEGLSTEQLTLSL